MNKKEILGPEEKAGKEKINAEGWEDNAMAVIGTAKERERVRKLVESEGRAADLSSFIRLNKKIVVPAEFVSETILKVLSSPDRKMGSAGFLSTGGFRYALYFFDKDLNLAEVKLNLNKIDEFKSLSVSAAGEKLLAELQQLQFSFDQAGSFWGFSRIKEAYQEHLEVQGSEQAKKEFDF